MQQLASFNFMWRVGCFSVLIDRIISAFRIYRQKNPKCSCFGGLVTKEHGHLLKVCISANERFHFFFIHPFPRDDPTRSEKLAENSVVDSPRTHHQVR